MLIESACLPTTCFVLSYVLAKKPGLANVHEIRKLLLLYNTLSPSYNVQEKEHLLKLLFGLPQQNRILTKTRQTIDASHHLPMDDDSGLEQYVHTLAK